MKAYWIEHDHLFDGKVYECSRCSSKCRSAYSVCPVCGADMSSGSKYEPDFVEECFMMLNTIMWD